jgi:guanosine-3',5'-bis(diphosphate) 3'-pyrophosphohydrolase
VAYILAELQSGPETLASGLFHDTVEDTDLTIEDIRKQFGDDVAMIVDSLTKIQRMKLSHRTEQDFEAEDHRKIFLGHGQRRPGHFGQAGRPAPQHADPRGPQARPPASLSQGDARRFHPDRPPARHLHDPIELEDLSLKYLEPAKYNEILDLLNKKEANRQESLNNLKKRIADMLFEKQIPFRIESRVKSIYSIYRKMYLKNYNFDEIYDVLAVRIITKTEMNCYEILGIIHATYKPIPGRFKDYIAMPKPNMYQSLHTSIISGDGNIYEVQIRTEEMDEIAETGIAAHWRYKEGEHYNAKEEQRDIEEKLHLVPRFRLACRARTKAKRPRITWPPSRTIFSTRTSTFSPRLGKVIDLPTGATTLDFAYKIHTKVGDSAVGAIVNGTLVPLNTVLKTGDVCEIRTSKTASGPNEGWLDIAKTASAKAHIKKAIQKKNSDIMKTKRSGAARALSKASRPRISAKARWRNCSNQPKVFDNTGSNLDEALCRRSTGRTRLRSRIIEFLNVRKKKDELQTRPP